MLTNEEMLKIIADWHDEPLSATREQDDLDLVRRFREAEREKGEADDRTCRICGRPKAGTTSSAFAECHGHEAENQAYADKVLEKQRQIIESNSIDSKQWSKPSDWATVVHNLAVKLVDAANEAARKREGES